MNSESGTLQSRNTETNSLEGNGLVETNDSRKTRVHVKAAVTRFQALPDDTSTFIFFHRDGGGGGGGGEGVFVDSNRSDIERGMRCPHLNFDSCFGDYEALNTQAACITSNFF